MQSETDLNDVNQVRAAGLAVCGVLAARTAVSGWLGTPMAA